MCLCLLLQYLILSPSRYYHALTGPSAFYAPVFSILEDGLWRIWLVECLFNANVKGAFVRRDGTFVRPDGTYIRPDGTFVRPDGTFVGPDGRSFVNFQSVCLLLT